MLKALPQKPFVMASCLKSASAISSDSSQVQSDPEECPQMKVWDHECDMLAKNAILLFIAVIITRVQRCKSWQIQTIIQRVDQLYEQSTHSYTHTYTIYTHTHTCITQTHTIVHTHKNKHTHTHSLSHIQTHSYTNTHTSGHTHTETNLLCVNLCHF